MAVKETFLLEIYTESMSFATIQLTQAECVLSISLLCPGPFAENCVSVPFPAAVGPFAEMNGFCQNGQVKLVDLHFRRNLVRGERSIVHDASSTNIRGPHAFLRGPAMPQHLATQVVWGFGSLFMRVDRVRTTLP